MYVYNPYEFIVSNMAYMHTWAHAHSVKQA